MKYKSLKYRLHDILIYDIMECIIIIYSNMNLKVNFVNHLNII